MDDKPKADLPFAQAAAKADEITPEDLFALMTEPGAASEADTNYAEEQAAGISHLYDQRIWPS